jgi:hypothetical protein
MKTNAQTIAHSLSNHCIGTIPVLEFHIALIDHGVETRHILKYLHHALNGSDMLPVPIKQQDILFQDLR